MMLQKTVACHNSLFEIFVKGILDEEDEDVLENVNMVDNRKVCFADCEFCC